MRTAIWSHANCPHCGVEFRGLKFTERVGQQWRHPRIRRSENAHTRGFRPARCGERGQAKADHARRTRLASNARQSGHSVPVRCGGNGDGRRRITKNRARARRVPITRATDLNERQRCREGKALCRPMRRAKPLHGGKQTNPQAHHRVGGRLGNDGETAI